MRGASDGLAASLASGLPATPPLPLIDVLAQHDRYRPAAFRDGLVAVYTI